MKLMRPAILALALLPAALFGANKEMVQLQRDVALLQDDVKTLQRSLDDKMSALRTLVEQTLAAASKVRYFRCRSGKRNPRPHVGAAEELDRTGREHGRQIDQMATDFQTLRESIADLTERMNKMQTQLVDLNNTVKVLSAPPAPPPSGSTAPGGLSGSTSAAAVGPAAGYVRQDCLRDRYARSQRRQSRLGATGVSGVSTLLQQHRSGAERAVLYRPDSLR